MKKTAVLAALVLAAGCQTIGERHLPPPKVAEGKALVHFIRNSVSYGNLAETVFSVDDANVVGLHNKGYSWIYLAPGTYTFSAGGTFNNDYLKFVMPVEAGGEYFVLYRQERAGYNTYRNTFQRVSPEIGRGLMQNFAYKEAGKIPDKAKE